MKSYFVFTYFIIISIVSGQQSKGTISGKVVDKVTQKPIPGVNIVIPDTDFGVEL